MVQERYQKADTHGNRSHSIEESKTRVFVVAVLVFIAWKPLGQPPAPANLALAIALVLGWVIQALFSFYLGKCRATALQTPMC